MKKTLISTCIVFIALALFSSTAFSWGVATHAYIGKELGKKYGYLNLQEIYGAMAPDIPWIMFDPKDVDISIALGTLTHYNFQNVADVAWWRSQKAFAYGFTTHNEVWGADYWAHRKWSGNDNLGYTKDKADELMDTWCPEGYPGYPNPVLFWGWVESLGKPGFDAFVAEAAIEHGIDILVKRDKDPTIGLSMLFSAWLRSPSAPWLLVRAYAEPLANHPDVDVGPWEAAKKIIATEKEFRQLIMLYGLALLQEDEVAAVAEIAATQFSYLLETSTPPSQSLLKALAIELIEAAKDLCKETYPLVLEDTIEAIAEN